MIKCSNETLIDLFDNAVVHLTHLANTPNVNEKRFNKANREYEKYKEEILRRMNKNA